MHNCLHTLHNTYTSLSVCLSVCLPAPALPVPCHCKAAERERNDAACTRRGNIVTERGVPALSREIGRRHTYPWLGWAGDGEEEREKMGEKSGMVRMKRERAEDNGCERIRKDGGERERERDLCTWMWGFVVCVCYLSMCGYSGCRLSLLLPTSRCRSSLPTQLLKAPYPSKPFFSATLTTWSISLVYYSTLFLSLSVLLRLDPRSMKRAPRSLHRYLLLRRCALCSLFLSVSSGTTKRWMYISWIN